ANAGGPYATSEGASLVVSGALSMDPNGDRLNYAWDLNNDGMFTDAAGMTATVIFPDGPDTRRIALRVSDESGVTGTQTTTVTIHNVAPRVSTTGPYTGAKGSPIAFTGNYTDVPSDTHTFLWSFGDGGASTLRTPTHAYADNGVYTAVFTATDDDGGFNVVSTTVTVRYVTHLPLVARHAGSVGGDSSRR
ncbi:MAG: PKD domain-containing protein, partial [Anaerolineae bacterium]